MSVFRKKGLSFRRKRKKFNLCAAKRGILWVAEIAAVVAAAALIVYFAGMKVTVVGNSMESSLDDGSRILVNRLIYHISEPRVGDVVVFLPNGNEKSHYYVKRVVGVPGDKVQIRDGVLYVNGEPFDTKDAELIRNPGIAEDEIEVPEDEYFVLGDNRNNSEDSRYANIGNVKKEFITGKAWFTVSPIRDIGRVK